MDTFNIYEKTLQQFLQRCFQPLAKIMITLKLSKPVKIQTRCWAFSGYFAACEFHNRTPATQYHHSSLHIIYLRTCKTFYELFLWPQRKELKEGKGERRFFPLLELELVMWNWKVWQEREVERDESLAAWHTCLGYRLATIMERDVFLLNPFNRAYLI